MLLLFAACNCCCFNVALEPKSAWSHKAYHKCHRNCSETSRNISQIPYIPCLTREKLVQLVGTCKTSSCGSACRSGLLPQCHGAAWRCGVQGLQGVQLSQGPNAQLIRLVNFHVLFQKLSNFGLGPDVLDMAWHDWLSTQQNTKITAVESVNLCWQGFVEK